MIPNDLTRQWVSACEGCDADIWTDLSSKGYNNKNANNNKQWGNEER